jgi:signal transduction histidine kinase
MPDQDSHARVPDSDKTTTRDDRATPQRNRKDLTIGSAQQTPEERGRSRLRRDTGVIHDTHDARGTPLKDILGTYTTRHSRPAGDRQTQTHTMQVFQAQEETTRRIAQHLHDDAAQMLALAYLELAKIAREASPTTAERIERVIGHLDSVSEQIRGLSHEMHPATLERHGLLPALHRLAEGIRKRSGLEVTVDGEAGDLPPVIELTLYRVVQEALSNVVRHANASEALVRLWKSENRILCSVRDDGTGFRPAEHDSDRRYETGLGLVGISERVDSLGGDCHVLSGDREGMELIVGIPL